jgi:cyclin L
MEVKPELTLDNYLDDVATNIDNPYFPMAIKTPSELLGMSKEDERNWRLFGATWIQIWGILLKLPQPTIAAGCAIFQRFYYKKPFMKCDCWIAALSSLFIATKIEEQPRKLRDTVSTFDYAKKILNKTPRPIPVLEFGSMEFTSLKKDTINGERYIMKVLGFQLDIVTPYKFLWEYIEILHGTNRLRQKAWNYVNDAFKTIVVVWFPPNQVAVTAIEMASRSLNYELPDCEWYKIFGVKDYKIIQIIGSEILQLYEMELPTEDYVKKCSLFK